jgi:isopenicillin N synthase-like dioxygenase
MDRTDIVVANVIRQQESYSLGSDNNPDQLNIWARETTIPGFQEFMTSFYSSCWNSAQLVLRALALGLGLDDEEFLLKFHGETENQLALRHYPPIRAQIVENGESDQLGTHSDFDSFTLLWQDTNGGLQFKAPGTGLWTNLLPIEGAVMMNIGDVLQRWSNGMVLIILLSAIPALQEDNLPKWIVANDGAGKLQVPLHRVHLPPYEENFDQAGKDRMTNERFSIPFFVPPKFDVSMTPLKSEYVCKDSSSLEPITFRQLFEEKMARMQFG